MYEIYHAEKAIKHINGFVT